MLPVLNVEEDISELNAFIMDCIRIWYCVIRNSKHKITHKQRICLVGNLGYENRKDKHGVISRGTGSSVTTCRKLLPELEGYLSLGMMQKLYKMNKSIYKSKLAA